MPEFVMVALRWAAAWAVVGLVVGLLFMLGKTLSFAESGAKPDNVLGYVLWVPILGGAAAAGGLGIGLIFTGLMALTEEWRDSLELGPGILAKLAPYLLCGAGAGLIAGLLVGGLAGALFFGLLGACSAAVLNWRAARDA